MKIRFGFVSNSSSSSFIVAFDKKPKTREELQKLLFGKRKSFKNPYSDPEIWKGSTPDWTAAKVTATVWNDLKKQKKSLTEKEVIEEFNCGTIPGYPHYDWKKGSEGTKEQQEAYWEEYEEKVRKFCTKQAQEFLKANAGKKLFRFSYSDNDGQYFAALEHGDLFELLPHFCISHH